MANHNPPWNKGRLDPNLAPTKVPTLLDIAWAAGVYEGEGTCRAYPSRRSKFRWGITLRVSQKDSWLCPRLRELFGGSLNTFRIKGDDDPDRHYFKWELTGARAVGFLCTILVFMSPRRRQQIDKALSLWKEQPCG